ncbi:GntR family transcriptional regulator [Arthrobacter sp. SA17]
MARTADDHSGRRVPRAAYGHPGRKCASGEQLRETHIAADLGISRSPLREALTKLEEEGLVVKIPFGDRS